MITEDHVTDEIVSAPVPDMVREHLRPTVSTIDATNGEFADLPPIEENEGVLLTSEPVSAFRPWMVVFVVPFLCMCTVAGTGLGLLFGWEIWPVEWNVDEYQSAKPYNLREDYRREYAQALSDRYAYDMDGEAVTKAAGGEAGLLPTVCRMMDEASVGGNAPETIRLFAITHILGGCNEAPAGGE